MKLITMKKKRKSEQDMEKLLNMLITSKGKILYKGRKAFILMYTNLSPDFSDVSFIQVTLRTEKGDEFDVVYNEEDFKNI